MLIERKIKKKKGRQKTHQNPEETKWSKLCKNITLDECLYYPSDAQTKV